MGRLKWDAKVRMKQAKLKAARGEGNVGRQDVVEAIIEESVQAAQIGVKERFAEIARERGFDNDDDVGVKGNFDDARSTASRLSQTCNSLLRFTSLQISYVLHRKRNATKESAARRRSWSRRITQYFGPKPRSTRVYIKAMQAANRRPCSG